MWWDIVKVNFEFDPDIDGVGSYSARKDRVRIKPQSFLDPNDPDGIDWDELIHTLVHEGIHAGQATISDGFYPDDSIWEATIVPIRTQVDTLLSKAIGNYWKKIPNNVLFDLHEAKVLGREIDRIPTMMKKNFDTDEVARAFLKKFQHALLIELQANTLLLQQGEEYILSDDYSSLMRNNYIKKAITGSVRSATNYINRELEKVYKAEKSILKSITKSLDEIYNLPDSDYIKMKIKQVVKSETRELNSRTSSGRSMFNEVFHWRILPLLEEEALKLEHSVKGFK